MTKEEEKIAKIKEYNRLRYIAKGEQIRARVKEYSHKSRRLILIKNEERRKALRRQTPKWLTKQDKALMKAMKLKAQELTQVTGIQWDLDHIIPLRGKNVSGLNMPENLRIIPSSENIITNSHKTISLTLPLMYAMILKCGSP